MLKEKIGRDLAEIIEQKARLRRDRVTCPGDLPRVIGAQVTCEVIKAGEKVGTATVILDSYTRVRYTVDIDMASQTPEPPGPAR